MKKLTLFLIIVFSLLAIDLPFMMAYQATVSTLQFPYAEQTNTFNYLQDKEPLLVEYTAAELSHLDDVKKVMKFANFYLIFLLVVEIFILIIIFQTDKKYFYRPFLYGGLVAGSILLLSMLWGLADFTSFFKFMHQLIFPQGNWIFPEGSKLTTLFPVPFFMQVIKQLFLQSILFSLIFIGIGLFLKKKN